MQYSERPRPGQPVPLNGMRYKITFREEGKGPKVTRSFLTLTSAGLYIKDRWQGWEYADGPASFHTDYGNYDLRGFELGEVVEPCGDGSESKWLF